MRKLLHSLIFLVLISFSNTYVIGQVVMHNNGATISVDGAIMVVNGGDYENVDQTGASFLRLDNDAQVGISGSLNNSDIISVIDGTLEVFGNYSDGGNINTYFYSADSVIFHGDFGNATGVFDTDTNFNSVLVFDDANARAMASNDNSFYNHIVFTGGGTKDFVGKWNVYEVKFNNGVVNQVSASDTFYLVENGQVQNQSGASYYNGEFWNEGTGLMDFPIGNGADWRPIRLLASPVLATMGMKVSSAAPAGFAPVAGVDVKNVSNQRYWKATDLSGTYAGSQVMFLFSSADSVGTGTAALSELVVVQSDSTSPYNSIGNSATTNEGGGLYTITSNLVAGEEFIALGGGCSNVKVDIRALLEGAYTGGVNMSSDPNYYLLADAEYSDAAAGNPFTSNQGMYAGYSLPTAAPDNAIDVIAVILRETTMPYNRADTAYAWLMEDGSIRDFWSGTSAYVNFCDAVPGNTYYVEVQHKNHLPVMNNATLTASTAVPGTFVDFRSDLNIWGGGGVVQHGADFYIASGNANGDWSVNGLDRFLILVDQGNLVTGFTNTNVDFNDGVDIADEQLGQNNSLILLYSTAP